jgi:hypothetical protein
MAENGWRVGASDKAPDLVSDSESEDSEDVTGSDQVAVCGERMVAPSSAQLTLPAI